MQNLFFALTLLFFSQAVLATTDKVIVKKASSCSACHGKNGNSHNPKLYPSLAGMGQAEFKQKMLNYQKGIGNGPMAAAMFSIARTLTSEDIEHLAIFFNDQPKTP